jgi:hypothetical protein
VRDFGQLGSAIVIVVQDRGAERPFAALSDSLSDVVAVAAHVAERANEENYGHAEDEDEEDGEGGVGLHSRWVLEV